MFKRIFTTLLFAFGLFILSFGQEGKYKVVRGERPTIDLKSIPKDSYETNKLRIKLAASAENAVSQKSVEATGVFGIGELDRLNSMLGVNNVNSVFPTFVMKSEFSERHRAWGFHLWYDLDFKDNQDILEVAEKYLSIANIEIVEPIYLKEIVGYDPDAIVFVQEEQVNREIAQSGEKWIPNDPQLNEQWHYNNTGQQNGTPGCDIKLFDAWEIQRGNPSVIVAIIDGGIQHNHPDLQGNIWEEIGYNFVNNTPNIIPHNHGTHVAGTVSAVNNNGIGVAGVAGGSGNDDGVRLMSCQVFGEGTSQGGFDVAPVWAADNGAIISQNSWGYSNVGVYNQSALDAIDYFNANAGSDGDNVMEGGITIFAAGNDSSSGDRYPGCYSEVLAVAGMTNKDKVSWYTNYDTWVDISAPGGETNSVTARGVLSTATGSSYAFLQGTSMACPHVSGVAALVLSHVPGMIGPDELKEILLGTTDDHYHLNPGYEGMLGTGRLNAYNALIKAEEYIDGVINPKSFSAEAVSAYEIALSWQLNDESNPVILAFSTEPTFGIPDVNVQEGAQIEGGGTVLYVGPNTQFAHDNLEPVTRYHYRIWSFSQEENAVSIGRPANAITLCSSFSLPFEEDFSNYTIPMCWEYEGVNESSEVWGVSQTNHSEGEQTGEIKANWVYGTGISRLILPYFNTSEMNSVNLTFKHFLDSYAAGTTFKIQTSTDGVTWTDGPWEVHSSQNNIGPEQVEIEITQDLNNETSYIAFVIDGNHYQFNSWYIDDVEVDGIPTGAPLVMTNSPTEIFDDSAIVGGTITDPGDAPVTASGVVYSTKPNPKVGLDDVHIVYTSPLIDNGDFSISINNLNSGTEYYYRAFAENEIALTHGEQKSFQTLCGTIQPDYFQGFDTPELPACWENVSNTTDSTQVWKFGSFSSGLNESSSYAFINSEEYGSNKTQDADLISPAISVKGYDSITVSFNHYFRAYSSSKATFKQSIDGGLTWETINTWNSTTENPHFFEYSLTDFQDFEEILFAWNFVGSWAYYWCVDNVNITGVLSGSLPDVKTLEPVILGPNSVELKAWVNPNKAETSVSFEWGVNSTTEFSYDFPEYSNGDLSIDFSHMVNHLEPELEYGYRVVAENVFGKVLGEVVKFTTPSTIVVDNNINGLIAHPNPFEQFLTIEGLSNVYRIELYNLLGQKVLEQIALGEEKVDITTNELTSGVYMIRVIRYDGTTSLLKVVKQ